LVIAFETNMEIGIQAQNSQQQMMEGTKGALDAIY